MVNVRLVWICSVPDMIIPIPLILMSFTPTYIPIFSKFSCFPLWSFMIDVFLGSIKVFASPWIQVYCNLGSLSKLEKFAAQAGWMEEGGIKVSLFTRSSSSLSQAASRHITTRIIASFHPDVFNFACFHNVFHPFYFLYIFGYCHLMNVLSASPSSLILIHFRGSMPLWPGQKNAFNIEIV